MISYSYIGKKCQLIIKENIMYIHVNVLKCKYKPSRKCHCVLTVLSKFVYFYTAHFCVTENCFLVVTCKHSLRKPRAHLVTSSI